MKAKRICLSAMAAVFLVSLAGLFVFSPGAERFSLHSFLYAMQSSGREPRIEEVSGSDPIFTGRPMKILLGGETEASLTLLRYPSEELAAQEAACVEPDGFTVNFPPENGLSRSVHLSWVSYPHFFRDRDTILLYVGEDEELLAELESLFGPPFAGTGISGTADGSGTLTAE